MSNVVDDIGVPSVLLGAAQRAEEGLPQKAHFRISGLREPPRIQQLRRKHAAQLRTPFSKTVWALLGKGTHRVIEEEIKETALNDYKSEQCFFVQIGELIITGQIDLQAFHGSGVELIDWKITTAAFRDLHIEGWTEQLNAYALLFYLTHGFRPNALTIYAIYRDWSNWEAKRKTNYPQHAVEKIGINLWTLEEQQAFLDGRIAAHLDAWCRAEMDEPLPLCSDKDRWIETKWEVRNPWRKTPIKSYALKEDAEQYLKDKSDQKLAIVEKKSEPRRCAGNWCGVAEYCSQYQSELNGTSNGLATSNEEGDAVNDGTDASTEG